MNRHSGLGCIFDPQSIAVIGATTREGSVGRTVIENLANGSRREKLFAVNPKHEEVLGVRCYRDVASIPEKLDLAVVITPAPTVPGVIGECVRAGVGGAVVISAGFKERGAEGAKLEDEIRQQLRGGKMRLIGPNCQRPESSGETMANRVPLLKLNHPVGGWRNSSPVTPLHGS
jgi:acetyltransferase